LNPITNHSEEKEKIIMKNLKKLLCLALIFAFAFSMPAQAATKKVTAVDCEDGMQNYPAVTTGTYSVKVASDTWENGTYGCLKFKAKKAGTYKFTLKNTGNPTVNIISAFGKNKVSNHQGSSTKTIPSKESISVKYKLEKGDTVYLSVCAIDCGFPISGKAKLVIKKVK